MPGVINHETLDSGRVIKAPVNYGYSEIVDYEYTLVAAAGTNTINGQVVPIDYMWIIEALSLTNSARVINMIVYIREGAINHTLILDTMVPAAGRWSILCPTQITLRAGQFLVAQFYVCILNDPLFFRFHGRKVKLR